MLFDSSCLKQLSQKQSSYFIRSMEISGSNVNANANASNASGSDHQRQTNKDLNDWLPITASRNAKWWYSTFHNVTAVVGAGVLGLPFAMSQLSWGPRITVLVISWLVTFYSFWQLVQLHEVVPGRRFDRYAELGQYVFGEKLGYWLVMPQQMIVQIASNIVYMVTGGKSLKKSIELLFPQVTATRAMRQTYFIMFFAFLHLFLSQVPNFNSLRSISMLAAVMSFGYSMLAFVTSCIRGAEPHHHVSYELRSHTTAGKVFDVFNSLGTIAFAFAAHSVALEIQATIPSTPEKPSKKPMWRGCIVAYIIVAVCYLCVSISGYWAFGNRVDYDVLISLEKPVWLIAIANFMVFLHVLGSYQVFAMPVFDLIESYLVQNRNYTPGLHLRIIARSAYVALTGFIGLCLPFFGGLLGFFGGLAFSSTSYFLPCIMWLVVHRPKPWSFHWMACWGSIVVGVLITVLAPIGGARSIILSAKSYKMFS